MQEEKLQFDGLTQEQSDVVVQKAAFGIGATFWITLIVSIVSSFFIGPFAFAVFVFGLLQGFKDTLSSMNEDIKHEQLLNK
jgi:ABC-type phosphate transport system permease subunit